MSPQIAQPTEDLVGHEKTSRNAEILSEVVTGRLKASTVAGQEVHRTATPLRAFPSLSRDTQIVQPAGKLEMKRKDIVIFGDNTIVRGWDGQVDASDSGVGGTGSWGEPKPIKPKPKRKQYSGQYHGKTDTLIHLSVDEFNSALGIDIGAETVRDSVGQDVAFDSGVGGVSYRR